MKHMFEKIREKIKAIGNIRFSSYTKLLIAVEDVIKIVDSVEAEYADGWIPVEERYPDSDNYVLLSFKNFSVPQVGRYEEDEGGGAFYLGDETETCLSQMLIVNAWQPLTAPYRPGICIDKDCPYNTGEECPAAGGCAGYAPE